MIRILDCSDSIHFGNIYCNGVPVVKEIEIENLSQDIIFIEPKFSSRRKGIELLIEESNSDSALKDYVFSQYPVYRYAKRPNELNEYLYTIDKMDIQPGERKKVLLILSVTASFLNEIEEEGIKVSSSKESRFYTELYESLNDAVIQFHCFSTYPSIQLYDCSYSISFTTCRSKLNISSKTIYMSDLHVGMLYERQVEITNHSLFPTAFSFEPLHTNSYICSVFVPTASSYEILLKPRVLAANESVTITIRIQPLQTGYHEIPLRLINESYSKETTTLLILTLTTKAIKQQDIFFSEIPGKPLGRSDVVLDFGGCFEGKTAREELFITNESEYDVYVKPRSSRKEEIRFTAKPFLPALLDEGVSSQKSSISSEIDLTEPPIHVDETPESSKEEEVHEICVLAHSSFRICILFTPDCREENSLQLQNQHFYLLFELRSLKDYGEISLFCTASTCGCAISATPKLEFENCISGEKYLQQMELTNLCDLDCEAIIACAASSLSFPSTLLHSLSLSSIQAIEQEVHQQVASIAYSLVIPKRQSILLPVEYSVHTRQLEYSNYIAIFSLNSIPFQYLTCNIHASIIQTEPSLVDAFLISPKQEIDYQQVVIGAAALQVRTITNTKPFPLLFHIKSSSLLTPYIIPSSPEMIVSIEHSTKENHMQVMNNLNLDTVHQNESTFTTFPSPVTPKEQCFSPVVYDHRREKSDDVLFDEDRSTCTDDSFLLCSPRSIVNDNSFDLPLQDTKRNRSQSQFEPSFWEPEEPSIPSNADSQVDLSQPSEVLKWFTMDKKKSLIEQRRVKYLLLKLLKEHSIMKADSSFIIEANQSVILYLRYQTKLDYHDTHLPSLSLTIECQHPSEPTIQSPLFSNFTTNDHNSSWNSLPVSPIESDEPKSPFSVIEQFPRNTSALPVKTSRDLVNQKPLMLPPSVMTGTSLQDLHAENSLQGNQINSTFKQTIDVHVENIDCELTSAQTHLYFGRLYTKTHNTKHIRIFNNSSVDVPLLIRQSINYNLGHTKEEQELIIPAHGNNVMHISIEPSVVGKYKGSIIVINLLNWTKALHFILKAVICQEVSFTILSPIPIGLGTFNVNEKGKGVIKVQNTANRDLQYTVAKNKLLLHLLNSEGDDCNGIGYQALVEIRRSGKISNSLNSNEREHLESSKEKLLRDIRVCKRKGRQRAQEALERRLEFIIKRLNEDSQINTLEGEMNLDRFEETPSVQILLEPDNSSVLFVNIKVKPITGFGPVISEFLINGSVNVSRHLTNTQEVPINGIVKIPYISAFSSNTPKLKLCDYKIPFSVFNQNTMINSLSSHIDAFLFNNRDDDEVQYFILKNEIFDTLRIDIIWNNISKITPDFGEIRFRYKELYSSEMNQFANDIHEQVTLTATYPKLTLTLNAKESVEVSVVWRIGKKYKLLNQIRNDSILGFITIIPRRQNCYLLNLPIGFTPIRSHLTINHSVFPLGSITFDQIYPLKLAIQNTSDELMTVQTKPCFLLTTPFEEVLKPREKKVISLDLSLSAHVIKNGNVNCPIIFYSPDNTINQTTCLVKASVDHPHILSFPSLQPTSTVTEEESYSMKLTTCWFASTQEEEANSITSLVIQNIRDVDVQVTLSDSSNQFHFIDQDKNILPYVIIPQASTVTVSIQFTVINRYFIKPDSKLSRTINGSFTLQVSHIPPSTEDQDQEQESPLTTLLIHYTCLLSVAQFSLSQTVYHLISEDHFIQNNTFDLEIQNKNPSVPFPFTIEVHSLSHPSIQVILSKTEGLIPSTISVTVSVTCSVPGYSSFHLLIQHTNHILSKQVVVNIFNRNNYISIIPSSTLLETPPIFPSISMGNIAVTKYHDSSLYAINPDGSEYHAIQITNNGGIPAFLVPYTNFPIELEILDSSETPLQSPQSIIPSSSYDSIPSLLLDEDAKLPMLLVSELNYQSCGKCIEIMPEQTIELQFRMKPRESIGEKMSSELDKPKRKGILPFSGNICFFSSRGDNLFQQLVSIEGCFYKENISISSKMANFGTIFANTSRNPTIDVRIDNNSCSAVTLNVSRLPHGFRPTVYYVFSQDHHNESIQQFGIDYENKSRMVINSMCYASLIIELDMKEIEWKAGLNQWTLLFSTFTSPDTIIPLQLEGIILPTILSFHKDETPVNLIEWKEIQFPSLDDQVNEIEVINTSPKEAHVQIQFQQDLYQPLFSIEVVPNNFQLPSQSKQTIKLILHSKSIHSLTEAITNEMTQLKTIGELQCFADYVHNGQKDLVRTISDLSLSASFIFQQILSVSPPLLNIITIVDHFSKVNELILTQFDLSSHTNPSSPTPSSLSPRYSDLDISIVNTEAEEGEKDLPTKSLLPSLPSTYVLCHLDKTSYELQISNNWREKVNILLHRTHFEHKQHGLVFPGYSFPVFASWIEISDMIVVEANTTLSVTARIIPDLDFTFDLTQDITEEPTVMQISTLYMTQLQIQLPVTIHSTTSRNKQLTNDPISDTPSLSLSLIIRGASAFVDGNIIHVDTDNIPINTEKTIEILFAGDSREITKYLFTSEMNNCIEMIEKDSVTTLVKFNSPMIGIQSSLLLFSDKKKTDFCFIIFSASFVCNLNQLLPLQSYEMISSTYPYQESSDYYEDMNSLGKLPDTPLLLSSLNSKGKWEIIMNTEPIQLTGCSYNQQHHFESHVYALTNRSNIDITAVLFSNQKEDLQLFMINYYTNRKSKILVIPSHSTLYFTIFIAESDKREISKSSLVSNGYFRLMFSNLRKFYYSFQYAITWLEEDFSLRTDIGANGNTILPLHIIENKASSYYIEDPPRLFIKNIHPTKEKFILLSTALYLNPVIKSKNNEIINNPFGGRCFELAGNEECEISFELSIESYLDRIKQVQIISDEQIIVIKSHSSNEIMKVIFQVTNSKYIDRYEEISLLSASEMIFRHCMSIAESFIQNWLYFPISLQKENCNEIAVLLSQTTQLNSTQFSFSLLEELLLDYQCIKQVLIEIMRFKPEIRHFSSNIITFFVFIYSYPCFTVFIDTNTHLPRCLIDWVNELYDIVHECPAFYPHIGSLLHKLKALC